MNKELKRLICLSFCLLLISLTVIFTFGKTYTVVLDMPRTKATFKISGNKNIIKVLDKRQKGDKYYVKVKSIKPGKVLMGFDYGDISQERLIYVHKSHLITMDNYFGRSTYSEVIPLSFTIVLIYSLYILIKRYKNYTKENIYQYRNIAYLGIIIFLSFFTIDNIFSIFNYNGINDTISKTLGAMSAFSILLFPIAVITFMLVTISNIQLIRKEGKSLRNILGLFLGVFICLSTLLPEYTYRLLQQSQTINVFNLNSPGPYIYNFIEALVYLVISYLECLLIGTIIIAIKSVRRKIKYNKDYIIILGCQIKKDGSLTPLLKGRVDKALEFRNKQLEKTGKDLIFIPSGGKGPDEVISEAEAMKKYLIEKGIPSKNILIDNKSTNTYENIKFSQNLIKKKDSQIAFSTTNYHVLRAGLIATEQGLKIDGLGSKTKSYFWINAFIREFIGTLYTERKKHIVVIIIIIIAIILMISITYFANNL